jgi:hypothetical protein
MEFAASNIKIDKQIPPGEIIDFNLLREARKELGWR